MLRVCFFAIALLWAQVAKSQVQLVADRVVVEGGQTLVAEGQVDIFQGSSRLTATRVIYDRATGTLNIEGPLRLEDGSSVVILADSAALDPTLKEGVLRSAQMVLEEHLQVTAAQIERVGGRYTQAHSVAATSCQVCAGGRPIWEIRAKRVIHDTQEKQLYFDHASLRVLGVPIFYTPRLRLPDPTLERARGFLVPKFRTTTLLGTGITLPYFIPIGDHRDLTLTPYVSQKTTTLEWRYREAFRNGDISLQGAFSRDEVLTGKLRAYVLGNASFGLPQGFRLGIQAQNSADPTYLLDYSYPGGDRLESFVDITRVRRNENTEFRLTNFNSLRIAESNQTQPSYLLEAVYEKRFQPRFVGGDLSVAFNAMGTYRPSRLNVDGPDADTEVDGFDVGRMSITSNWHRRWTFATGVLLDAEAQADFDQYDVRQHAGFPEEITKASATFGATLSYPMVRYGATGVQDVIEPKLQLGWSDHTSGAVPNQDSTRIEFDPGNLFDFNRTPGFDLDETGNWIAAGLGWTRSFPDGTRMEWNLGRVFRETAASGFSQSSGLSGETSDWLLDGNLAFPNGISLLSRTIVSDDGSVHKSDVRFGLQRARANVSATYNYLIADAAENRTQNVEELSLQTSYRFGDFWTIGTQARYDFGVNHFANAGMDLRYRSQCVSVDFSISRRFTTSNTVLGSTDYGLSVGLEGFSVGRSGRGPKHACGRVQ